MSSKYRWPSSALSEEEMQALYQKKQQTQKPINQLIKEAVKLYLKEER
ncbi:MAG: hypothetical protein HND50_21910 [Calditrichaeota bacterium]|nr:hypothetical protein [Calditrichota bacterium]